MATAAAWWCLVAAAIHSPPAANAQSDARSSAQTEVQPSAQVDIPTNAQVTEHRLTLFHTNDLRGNIYIEEGFCRWRIRRRIRILKAQADRGGLAALVSMIRAHEGTGGDSILVLDGGNAMGATPACDVDDCRTLFQLMNMAGYDAMAVGGHEFTYGLDTLASRAGQADFPLLGANLEIGDTVDGIDDTVRWD